MIKIASTYNYYDEASEKYYIIFDLISDDDNIINDELLEKITIEIEHHLVTKINEKVDKISGMGLSEVNFTNEHLEKLKSIDYAANKYDHPTNHNMSIMVESSTKKILTSDERLKLQEIENGANRYIHPSKHIASDIIEDDERCFVTKNDKSKLRMIDNLIDECKHPLYHDASIIKETIGKNFVSSAEKDYWNNKIDMNDLVHYFEEKLETNNDVYSTLLDLSKSLRYNDEVSSILIKLSSKVDKIPGKGLSEENFTNDDRHKMDSIENYANNYVHPTHHPATMISGFNERILENPVIDRMLEFTHSRRHSVNDMLDHEGINAQENNIVSFRNDGLFKDSGKRAPIGDIIGTVDYQNMENKTIDNSMIGSNVPSYGAFDILKYRRSSMKVNGTINLHDSDFWGTQLYIIGETVIRLPQLSLIGEGANIELYTLTDRNVDIKVHYGDKMIFDGSELSNLLYIRSSGRGLHASIFKYSDNSWIFITNSDKWVIVS